MAKDTANRSYLRQCPRCGRFMAHTCTTTHTCPDYIRIPGDVGKRIKQLHPVKKAKYHCPECHGGNVSLGPGMLNVYCEKHAKPIIANIKPMQDAFDRVVMDALFKQVDGDHYTKMGIQPWEIIKKNKLDYWEGAALKYLLRWRVKDGVIDLDKIIHYIEHIKSLALEGHYGEKFKKG